jgi:hypothetical protein
MHTYILILLLIPFYDAFQIEKPLLEEFNCNIYKHINSIYMTTKDFGLELNVNIHKSRMDIFLFDNSIIKTHVKEFIITNTCPLEFICSNDICYHVKYFDLNIISSTENLEKMLHLLEKANNHSLPISYSIH